MQLEKPMKIVILTPELDKVNETGIVNQLFDTGLELLHIRKIGYSTDRYRKYISEIQPEYRSRLVMHGGGFDMCNEFSVAGLHLTSAQRSLSPVEISKYNANRMSSSFHKWSEITSCNLNFDYVFISPVFDSISKTNYKAGVDFRGLDKMKLRLQELNRPVPEVFGLGGIDIPHLQILREHHFDGAAVYGAVWKAQNPATFVKHILQLA